MKNTIITFCLLSLIFFQLQAQERTFGAGIVLGINASQIAGDDLAGFNKLGLHAGVRGLVYLEDNIYLSTAILYSERGSRTELIPGQEILQEKISTRFIEVPLVFNYLDWLNEDFDDPFYRLHFHGGLAYNRLLSASSEFTRHDQVIERELLVENNINWLLGATFFINPNTGFTVRYSRQFNFLYDKRDFEDDPDIAELNSLQPFWLTFRMEYHF